MRRLYQPACSATCVRIAAILISVLVAGQNGPARVMSISPTSGPEGTRVKISGENLQQASSVLFGQMRSDFKIISPDELIALVPHRTATSPITVVTPHGRSKSPSAFAVVNDPRVPDEVSHKSGCVNSAPRPHDFHSARMWGIAIADTRVPGYESAYVEIASTQLSCRIDGREIVLNEDRGNVHGGLFLRHPWFSGHNYHEPIPLAYDLPKHVVVLNVGQRTDRVWHFWSSSPRAVLPEGEFEGCTATARIKISPGALLQIGFDYWRSPTVPYGTGGNNHEAGASNWYFPSDQWQEAMFTDIGGLQF
jgi:hypothetical protein